MGCSTGQGDSARNDKRQRRLGAAVAALLGASALTPIVIPSVAQAQTQAVAFDIPSQPIASALVTYARQAGVQLVMSEAPSGGVQANAVQGSLSRERALHMLLEGTGYSGRLTNGSITLVRGQGGSSGAGGRGVQQEGSAEVVQLAENIAPRRPSQADDDIVVVGSNIRGARPQSSPIDIYSEADIERTGSVTTEQFIARLPQNLGTRNEYAASAVSRNINREAVSSPDLRGLGVGTTLTLLNGRRLGLASSGQAPDISVIPLSALQRVEVLTDGASAIYGSDAVGGVVNFVLRRDYDGAETRVGYAGATESGLRQGSASQLVGRTWGSGNVLGVLDFFSASPLEHGDRTYASAAGPGYLTPVVQRGSGLITFNQELGEQFSLSGDLLVALREHKNYARIVTGIQQDSFNRGETQQIFGNLVGDWDINDALRASLLVTYSDVDVDNTQSVTVLSSGVTSSTRYDTNHQALDTTATLGGELFDWGAGVWRFTIGAGRTFEDYRGTTALAGPPSGRNLGRNTTYAFAELLAPLVSEEQGIPFVHRLELSLAGRYTEYSDESDPSLNREFGDDTVPKIGLLWSPMAGFNFRGTYGESFRAPSLSEIDPTAAQNALFYPSTVEGDLVPVMILAGPSADLEAETAESRTLGFDWRPEGSGLQLSATYFNIEYENRIGQADTNTGRVNPALAPQAVYQADAAQYEFFLRSTVNVFNNLGVDLSDPAAAGTVLAGMSDLWVIDNRYRNLAISRVEGVDLNASYSFDTSFGAMDVGAQATHIIEYEQQDAEGAPINSIVDTVTRPVDWRARFYTGLTRGAFTTTLNLNYVDDYTNPLALGGPQKIDSWTTIDWNGAYEFGGGLRLSASIQNLFDEDPPYVSASASGLARPVGFDPANANPLGRFVAIGVTQTW